MIDTHQSKLANMTTFNEFCRQVDEKASKEKKLETAYKK
jgi:hypothetical protein|tara:strand:+ start:1335 stop:1451 length:117 start_codon:yes stop_codon:yes gene_type:complete